MTRLMSLKSVQKHAGEKALPLGSSRPDSSAVSLPGIRAGRIVAASACILFILLTIGVRDSEAAQSAGISSVAVSRSFFNPSLRQTIEISMGLGKPGVLDVSVVDRNGQVVRRLTSRESVKPGKRAYVWDGRDAAGEIVSDEAYSMKIVLARRDKTESYSPAASKPHSVNTTTTFYDPQAGILAYKLAAPARVWVDAHSGETTRTIVNGEPRTGGSVIDYWNGFDKGGKVYLAGRPDFSISVSTTALPENAIITIGNRAAAAQGVGK
jgi:hypothetical protein